MALVKFGAGITEIRGSIGGVTFSRSYSGPVMKEKPIPPRRRRGTQPKNRSIIGFLSRQWGGLTGAQRDEWKTWALNHPEPDRFGGTFIMSGSNAYSKLNFQAVRLFGMGNLQNSPPSDPPAANLYSLVVASGSVNPGDITLDWTAAGTGSADDVVEVQRAGPFQSEGLVEVHNQFRHIASPAGNLTTLTVEDLVEGFWYWFRLRYVDQYGQTTAFLTGQATPMVTP